MTIETSKDQLIVAFEGWERLWALRRRLVLGRANIIAMRWDPDLHDLGVSLRIGGTSVPGRLLAGNFMGSGKRQFLYVRRPRGWLGPVAAKTLNIDLKDHRYTCVILSAEKDQAKTLEKWWRTGR